MNLFLVFILFFNLLIFSPVPFILYYRIQKKLQYNKKQMTYNFPDDHNSNIKKK